MGRRAFFALVALAAGIALAAIYGTEIPRLLEAAGNAVLSPPPNISASRISGAKLLNTNSDGPSFETDQPIIRVSGNIDGADTLQFRVAETSQSFQVAAAHGTYTSRPIFLQPGANQIEISAMAQSGVLNRATTQRISITLTNAPVVRASRSDKGIKPVLYRQVYFQIGRDQISFEAYVVLPSDDPRFTALLSGEMDAAEFMVEANGLLAVHDGYWSGNVRNAYYRTKIGKNLARVVVGGFWRHEIGDPGQVILGVRLPANDDTAPEDIHLRIHQFAIAGLSPVPGSKVGKAVRWQEPGGWLRSVDNSGYKVSLVALPAATVLSLPRLRMNDLAGPGYSDLLIALLAVSPFIWLGVLLSYAPLSGDRARKRLAADAIYLAALFLIGPIFFAFRYLSDAATAVIGKFVELGKFQYLLLRHYRSPDLSISLDALQWGAMTAAAGIALLLIARLFTRHRARAVLGAYLHAILLAFAAAAGLAALEMFSIYPNPLLNLSWIVLRFLSAACFALFAMRFYKSASDLALVPAPSRTMTVLHAVLWAGVGAYAFLGAGEDYLFSTIAYGAPAIAGALSQLAAPLAAIFLMGLFLRRDALGLPLRVALGGRLELLFFAGFIVGPSAGWLGLPLAMLAAVVAHRFILVQPRVRFAALARLHDEICEKRSMLLERASQPPAADSPKDSEAHGASDDEAAPGSPNPGRAIYDGDVRYDPAELALAFGPYPSARQNALRALRVGAILAVPFLLAYYQRVLPHYRIQPYDFPILWLLAGSLNVVMPLLTGAFYLGYFYPRIRGRYGWEKGLAMAVVISLCVTPFELLRCASLSDAWPVAASAVERGLFFAVLGWVGFDHATIRKYLVSPTLSLKQLFYASGVTLVAGLGSAAVATLGVAITTAVTTGVTTFVTYVGTQPGLAAQPSPSVDGKPAAAGSQETAPGNQGDGD